MDTFVFNKIFKQYIEHNNGLSKNTKKSYKRAYSEFERYTSGNYIDKVDINAIDRFKKRLITRNLSTNTIHLYLAVLNSFIQWMDDNHIHSMDKVIVPRKIDQGGWVSNEKISITSFFSILYNLDYSNITNIRNVFIILAIAGIDSMAMDKIIKQKICNPFPFKYKALYNIFNTYNIELSKYIKSDFWFPSFKGSNKGEPISDATLRKMAGSFLDVKAIHAKGILDKCENCQYETVIHCLKTLELRIF